MLAWRWHECMRRRCCTLALALLCALLQQPGDVVHAAGAALYSANLTELLRSTPWCRVALDCKIPEPLLQLSMTRGVQLIHHPVPDPGSAWPTDAILRRCQKIAYCPAYTDGVGSQYNRISRIIAYAWFHDLQLVHTPITAFGNHDVDVGGVEAFFNAGHGALSVHDVEPNDTVCLVDFCNPPVDEFQVRALLRQRIAAGSLFTAAPLPSFGPDTIHVAVHIRRGDVIGHRDRHRFLPNSYYDNIVSQLSTLLAGLPHTFHVFSEGQPSDFANITSLRDASTVWHLDEDIVASMRGMMCSDVFVTAPSSLSGLIGSYLHSGMVLTPRVTLQVALKHFAWTNASHCKHQPDVCVREALQQRMAGRVWRLHC